MIIIVSFIVGGAVRAFPRNNKHSNPASLTSRMSQFMNLLERNGFAFDHMSLKNSTSSQFRALAWIAHEDPMKLPPDKDGVEKRNVLQIIQRYCLAMIFFDTGGQEDKWKNKTDWLSGKPVCGWDHVGCKDVDSTGSGPITDLDFGKLVCCLPRVLVCSFVVTSLRPEQNQCHVPTMPVVLDDSHR